MTRQKKILIALAILGTIYFPLTTVVIPSLMDSGSQEKQLDSNQEIVNSKACKSFTVTDVGRVVRCDFDGSRCYFGGGLSCYPYVKPK
jgi:hypothetical protein